MEDLLNFSFRKKDDDNFTEDDYNMMYEIFKKEIEEDNLKRISENKMINQIDELYIINTKTITKFDIEHITNYPNLNEYIKGKVELNGDKLNINKEIILYDHLKQKLNLSNEFDYQNYIVKNYNIIKNNNINLSNKNNQNYIYNSFNNKNKYNAIESLIQFGKYFMLDNIEKINQSNELIYKYYKQDEELLKIEYIDHYILFYKDIKKLNNHLSKNTTKNIYDNCLNIKYKELYILKSKRIFLMKEYKNLIANINNNKHDNYIIYNNINNEDKNNTNLINKNIRIKKPTINMDELFKMNELGDCVNFIYNNINKNNENKTSINKENQDVNEPDVNNINYKENNNNTIKEKNKEESPKLSSTIKLYNGKLKVVK